MLTQEQIKHTLDNILFAKKKNQKDSRIFEKDQRVESRSWALG